MERKIVEWLRAWKTSENRRGLVISGLNGVGKTYTICEFATNEYKNYVYFNIESNNIIRKMLEKEVDESKIIMRLEEFSHEKIDPKDTLIILDDIHASEKALLSLKYFGNYHVIAIGTNVEPLINKNKTSSLIGKIQFKNFYPLDFEEFLMALGKGDMVEKIRNSYLNNKRLEIHKEVRKLFETYIILGGLPQVIKEYVENGFSPRIAIIQKNIFDSMLSPIMSYKYDLSKIEEIIRSIPDQLLKENKKFKYASIRKGARESEYIKPFEFLGTMGLIIKCHKVDNPATSLVSSKLDNSFKIYFRDLGMLTHRYGLKYEELLDDKDIHNAMIESFVAASLLNNGYVPYYWESKGKASIAFVTRNKEGIVFPIDVKIKDVPSKDLNSYIKINNPVISVRVSDDNFSFKNGIKTIPYYAIFCL